MTASPQPLTLRQTSREEVRKHRPLLTEWLLPESFYSIEQTWPSIYRLDGSAEHFVIERGGDLLSHTAVRMVELQGSESRMRAGLIGSVATSPAERGNGLATRLLAATLRHAEEQGADAAILWAEQPELYARLGFGDYGTQWQTVISGSRAVDGVRVATFDDHDALLALHERKPLRVLRDAHEMHLLLSTPGTWTTVLERGGGIEAYACCGKGADLQGWWHEFGGEDEAVAELLRGSLHELETPVAMAMLPGYRTGVMDLLQIDAATRETAHVAMVKSLTPVGEQDFFVDGLDSV